MVELQHVNLKVQRTTARLGATAVVFILPFVGAILHAVAYQSAFPLVIAALLVAVSAGLLTTTPLGGRYERRMFRTAFSVGWVAAGIAAVYAMILGDPSQLERDAMKFFRLASQGSWDDSLLQLSRITEGAAAVIIWRWVYRFVSFLGLPIGMYIGVVINTVIVAFTGVVAIKTAKLLYGLDQLRLRRLVLLFSCCGMFWLFAGLHLRDAFVLFGVTVLVYYWVRYLRVPRLSTMVTAIAVTLLGTQFMGFLRKEFSFVPIATAFVALLFGPMWHVLAGTRKIMPYLIVFLSALSFPIIAIGFGDYIFGAVSEGYSDYLAHAEEIHDQDSLGMRLILRAPLPVRLVLGSGYLFVFPIPVWSGFQLVSAYHLFKSLNAIYFYFFTPLLVLALYRILTTRLVHKRRIFLFLIMFLAGFTVAVAATSLETRHLGVFLVPALLVAIFPDMTNLRERVAYKRLLLGTVISVTAIHIVWYLLKI